MDELQKLIDGLKRPTAYPHRPDEVIFIQTSISVVFVAGEYVYKIKKPVNFGYLDFSTLEKRKFFCEEELRLNRRLCPDIYLDIVPITKERGEIQVGGTGTTVDFAVLMKRLPQEGMMDELLHRGEVEEGHVIRIARLLVPFYREARTGPGIDKFGTISSFSVNTDENFSQTEKYIGVTISKDAYEDIRGYTERFYSEKESLFTHRIDGGYIRECHGDLHSRNICITEKDVYIYDCIEFNERFRISDVAEDIAFLAMDLDFHLFPSLSRSFVSEYVRLSRDETLREILTFYKSYTAFVRGKVLSFILDETEESEAEKTWARDQARYYFHLARVYALSETHPLIIITCGLSGSGKSKIATHIASEMDMEIIRSDAVRKELSGIRPEEHRYESFSGGIYSREMTRRTYDELFFRAEKTLREKRSVIIDASYLRGEEREKVRELAGKVDAQFYILFTRCPDDVTRTRLVERVHEGTISDATIDIYEKQKEIIEPPKIEEEDYLITVDTTKSPRENVKEILGRILLGM
jgi:aminoglycoside phosphotransferase family enzyme/predicted kinase